MLIRSFVLLAAASTLVSCNMVADAKTAEGGVTSFHQALDGGQYGQIYDGSDQAFKSVTTRKDFINLLTLLHNKLGSFKSGSTTGLNDNVNGGGHFLTLQENSKFEKGPAVENFVFRLNRGRTSLVGYHVSSSLLISG